MNKELTPLEALQDLSKLVFIYGGVEQYKIIEKALKVLEIIKERKVNVLDLSVCANYETYMTFFKQLNWNGEYDDYILTQEEYNLLKEYFK